MTDLTRIALSTGVSLDVQLAGAEGAPPVILLHGFPESHRTWRHIVPDLARDHRVVAPAHPGDPRTGNPAGGDAYTPHNLNPPGLGGAPARGRASF
ncbi:MAG: alpha/beta fold hydrolase, partial [Novosphingobium sp.]